jgi:hypothetical protein
MLCSFGKSSKAFCRVAVTTTVRAIALHSHRKAGTVWPVGHFGVTTAMTEIEQGRG